MRVSVEFDVQWPARLRSRRRRAIAAAIAAVALVLPGAVVASHQFTDVPTTHTFHDEVSALAGARITAGCGPTFDGTVSVPASFAPSTGLSNAISRAS